MALIDLQKAHFNWLFLIELVIVVIVVVFYLFFLNRFLGSALGFFLRIAFWRRNNAYFECESVQISPLSGHILFKDLKYSSRSQSIRVFKGYVRWRYWRWHVRNADQVTDKESNLPCRISFSCSGIEWFIYNRTPAYDDILDRLGVRENKFRSFTAHSKSQAPTWGSQIKEKAESLFSINWLTEALPVELEARTGSIVIGNRSCHSVAIAGFEKASGRYGAVPSRSSLDLYKHTFNVSFTHPRIVYRTNPDYDGDIAEHGRLVSEIVAGESTSKSTHGNPSDEAIAEGSTYSAFSKLLKSSPTMLKSILSLSLPSPPAEVWQGLSRYKIDDHTYDAQRHPVEYAKVLTLLDSPRLDLEYYSDSAGLVPVDPVTRLVEAEASGIGNGDEDPEWGVNLKIMGGTLNYGPWADRQRVELQSNFFPPNYSTSDPTNKLSPGDSRVHTAFRFFVDFKETTSIRVPTREASKDWRYEIPDEIYDIDPSTRPYGWLNFTVGSNSTLSFVVPMVMNTNGYENLLEVHAESLTCTSSVNYVNFLKAEQCKLSAVMPNPLIWDAHRNWNFNLSMNHTDAYLLRDHVTLLVDLIDDWTSGPEAPIEQFVPLSYTFKICFSDYRLHLYLNDHNIINNPTTVDDNSLLILSGPSLSGTVGIPSREYKAYSYTINYSFVANDLEFAMSLPGWNTHGSFATENTKPFGTVEELSFEIADYRYSQVHPNHVESLDIKIRSRGVLYKCFGWTIRHFLSLRDNYFGDFCHFLTLEEYRFRHKRNVQGDPLEKKYRPERTNDSQVTISWNMLDGMMALPQELYDCRGAVIMNVPEISVTFRIHDYLMELDFNIDPVDVTFTDESSNLFKLGYTHSWDKSNTFFVEGVDATAHRLFGPQPRTSTYVCIWDIHLGSVHGDITAPFIQALNKAAHAFAANYIDHDNALPAEYAIKSGPDMTLVTVNSDEISLTVWGGDRLSAKLDLVHGFSAYFDDVPSKKFKEHIEVDVPQVELGSYLLGDPEDISTSTLSPKNHQALWAEIAHVSTDLNVVVAEKFTGWKAKAEEQCRYVERQDAITERAKFLYGHTDNLFEYPILSRKGGFILPLLEPPYSSVREHEECCQGDCRPNYRKDNPISQKLSMPESENHDSDSDATTSVKTDLSNSGNSNCTVASSQAACQLFGSYADVLRFVPWSEPWKLPKFSHQPRIQSESSFKELPTLHQRLEFLSQMTSQERQQSEKVTQIDAISRQGIRGVVIPSVMKVVASIQRTLFGHDSFEQWLDEVYLRYSKARLFKSPFQFSTVQLGISLPSIEINAYHHMTPTTSKDRIENNSSPLFSLMKIGCGQISACAERCLDHLASEDNNILYTDMVAQVHTVPIRQIAQISVKDLNVGVYNARMHTEKLTSDEDSKIQLPGRNDGCVLEIACDDIVGQVAIEMSSEQAVEISATTEPIHVSFVDTPAELIASAAYLWVLAIEEWRDEILSEAVPDNDTKTLRLVTEILRFSRSHNITTDPSFLNRVSYLVQTTSSNLRTDDGWKILAHLRHCLRLMDEFELQRTKDVVYKAERIERREDLMRDAIDILSDWRTWEIDSGNLGSSQLLSMLYMPTEQSTDDRLFSIVSGYNGRLLATMSIGPLIANYFTPETSKESSNTLFCGSLDVSLAFEQASTYIDQKSVSIGFKIRKFSVELDSAIFSLVHYVAQVRSLFEHRMRRLTLHRIQRDRLNRETVVNEEKQSPIDDKHHTSAIMDLSDVAVFVTLGVEHVDLSVQTQGFELLSTNTNLLVSGTCQLAARSELAELFEIVQATAYVGTDRLNCVVSEQSGTSSAAFHDSSSFPIESFPILIIDVISVVSNLGLDFTHEDTISFFGSVRALQVYVPRSLLRMFHLIEDWKDGAIPKSRSLFKELKHDLEVGDQLSPLLDNAVFPPSANPSGFSMFSAKLENSRIIADISVSSIHFGTQALSTLALNYDLNSVSLNFTRKSGDINEWNSVGLDMGQQKILFSTSEVDENGEHGSTQTQVIPLPSVAVLFKYEYGVKNVEMSVLISKFAVNLSTSMIDSALAIQSRFGSDIDELIELITSKKRTSERTTENFQMLDERSTCFFKARTDLQGFQIKVDSPASVQYFEADSLSGSIASKPGHPENFDWEASIGDFSLSVAQNSSEGGQQANEAQQNRKYRLAYFNVALEVSNKCSPTLLLEKFGAYQENPESLYITAKIPRLHAVMQAGATDALAEMVDFYLEELRWRKETRAAEIYALRNRFRNSIEAKERPVESSSTEWFQNLVLSVEASSISIAIPLQREEVDGPSTLFSSAASKRQRRTAAFLTSISSASFATSRGNAGYGQLEHLSIQYVNNFDQGHSRHFDGSTHLPENCARFSSMQCVMRPMDNTHGTGAFVAEANVPGLEIDLSPSLVDYSFQLFDVFQAGKQRLEKLVAQDDMFRENAQMGMPNQEATTSPTPPMPKRNPLKRVKANFEFSKGTLRLHSDHVKEVRTPKKPQRRRPQYHRRGHSVNDIKSDNISNGEQSAQTEEFTIPGLTLWAEYLGQPSANEIMRENQNSLLHFDSTVHSSNNTLYPTLLPFFASVASDVQVRMKSRSTSAPRPVSNNIVLQRRQSIPMQITVSLRIDRSRLEISCQPSAPVSAALSWRSGGFLFSFNSNQKKLTFAARIDEIGMDLRHAFSPEKCLGGNAKGLIVSASFSSLTQPAGVATFISVTSNAPEVSGEVNLRQLHDLLCLEMTWIDGLEEIKNKHSASLGSSTQPEMEPTRDPAAPRQPSGDAPIVTAVAIQVDQLSFDCNMGHAIGTSKASVGKLALAAHKSDRSKALSVSFQEMSASSTGRLTAELSVGHSSFRSALRAGEDIEEPGPHHLLNIGLYTGQLKGSVQFDYRKILLIEADPTSTIVTDDWSDTTPHEIVDAALRLSFTVTAGAFSWIATTQTIPTLVKISNDVERLICERRQKANMIMGTSSEGLAKSKEPKEAVSVVARGLLASGKSKSFDASVIITHKLHLEVDRLRLVVFPSHFTDPETFRADAGSITAALLRQTNAEGSIHRNLDLHLGFFSVRKLRLPRKVTPIQEREYRLLQWKELLREAGDKNIFRVPTTKVRMSSDQALNSNQIYHRFGLVFVGQVEMSLNYALLKTLGELVNAHQSGMKRVQANLDIGAGARPETMTSPPRAPSAFDASTNQQSGGADSNKADVPTRILKGVPEASTSVVTLPKPALQLGETAVQQELEFIALENVIEQPQLNLLGDATPPLEWLGVQRAKFPGWIHSGVTLTLEELLLVLSSTYKKQLARANVIQDMKTTKDDQNDQSNLTDAPGNLPA